MAEKTVNPGEQSSDGSETETLLCWQNQTALLKGPSADSVVNSGVSARVAR